MPFEEAEAISKGKAKMMMMDYTMVFAIHKYHVSL